MLREERLDFIINQLKSSQSVKLAELSEALQVSEDTIRRDIEVLAKNGLLTKVRGGAIPHSPNSHNFGERVHVSEKEKIAIANKALSLIKPGDTILLDGGTTTYTLAGLLDMPLTIITNNVPAAALLAGRKDMEVVLTGGRILPDCQATVGAEAIRTLQQLHVDTCFIGICSLHHEIGVSTINYLESDMKRAMIGCADRIVAITKHDKIGTAEPYKVCPIETLHTIVTEIEPDSYIFSPYREKGIQVL
ncbi:MAG: DeoR/GlpR family DNA-binding transcription regulator [Chitinophagaceae bacterium]